MPDQSQEPFEHGLRDLASEETPPFHYERTMAAVRQAKERKPVMKSLIGRTTIGIAAAAALFVGLLLIPVTYTVQVGSAVRIEIPTSTVTLSDFDKMFEKTDNIINRNINVSEDKAVLDLAFARITDQEAEKCIKDAFAGNNLFGDDYTMTSTNITREVGSNAFAALTRSVFPIQISGGSDEQIAAEIMQNLTAMGFVGADVQVRTEGDQIHFDMNFDQLPEGVEGDSVQFIITQ